MLSGTNIPVYNEFRICKKESHTRRLSCSRKLVVEKTYDKKNKKL